MRRVAGARVPAGVPRSSVHAEQGFMGQAGVDDAPVASSAAGSPSATHAPLAPLLSRSAVALLDLGVDRGAVAAVADGAPGHPSGHGAEHAAGAAQVLVRGEDFGGSRGRKPEVSPRTGGDRRCALRNTASWKHQGREGEKKR